jgi:hypothetical protein
MNTKGLDGACARNVDYGRSLKIWALIGDY